GAVREDNERQPSGLVPLHRDIDVIRNLFAGARERVRTILLAPALELRIRWIRLRRSLRAGHGNGKQNHQNAEEYPHGSRPFVTDERASIASEGSARGDLRQAMNPAAAPWIAPPDHRS